MTHPFGNGQPESRDPDSVDRSAIVPAALYVFDEAAGEMVAVRQGEFGGARPEATFLDPQTVWQEGFTPPADGTLLVQNLCRDCYAEAYLNAPPPLSGPAATPPVISVGPESWARVPVQGGVALSILMNGNVSPNHFDEVELTYLPGVVDLAGGPMPRHPEDLPPNYDPEVLTVGALETSIAPPYGANRALVIVTAGSAHIGLGNAPSAVVYAVGEGVELREPQFAALRLIRDGDVDATVRVDYWREA